jgi:UDPglucose 6-dehydrogenase
MKVTIFGTGYVGLVHAAVLADIGHEIVCVDIDAERIARLAAGEVPVFEPGLAPLLAEARAAGRLRFTDNAALGIAHGTVQFVAVGTPSGADGAADLGQVDAVADAIAAHLERPATVVMKSTVPVGTADRLAERIAHGLLARGRGELRFDVASNPEFLKEGAAVADCAKPDRIVVGIADPASEAVLRELYAPLNRHHEKFVVMDRRSAELTKYAAN